MDFSYDLHYNGYDARFKGDYAILVFLLRHGETEANREGKIIGQTDSPLTENGIFQTAEIIKLLSPEKIDFIISSPLGRACSTAGMISKAFNKSMIIHDGLSELSSGEWEGKYRKEILPSGEPLRKTWHEKPPGGESFRDCEPGVRRLISLVKILSAKYNVLLVGHGGINQVFLTLWYGLSGERLERPVQPHELVYILSDDNVKWMDSSGKKGEGWWKYDR